VGCILAAGAEALLAFSVEAFEMFEAFGHGLFGGACGWFGAWAAGMAGHWVDEFVAGSAADQGHCNAHRNVTE
jgi:hypothetical protein